MENFIGNSSAKDDRLEDTGRDMEADSDIGCSPAKKPRLEEKSGDSQADAHFAYNFASTIDNMAAATLEDLKGATTLKGVTSSRIRAPTPGEVSLDTMMAVHQAALGRPHPITGVDPDKIVETYKNSFQLPVVQANILRSMAAKLPEDMVQQVNQGITNAVGLHLSDNVLPMLSRSNIPLEMAQDMMRTCLETAYKLPPGSAFPSPSPAVKEAAGQAVSNIEKKTAKVTATASRVSTSNIASSSKNAAMSASNDPTPSAKFNHRISPTGWFNFPEESMLPQQYRAMMRAHREPQKLIKLKFTKRRYYLLGPAARDMSQDPMLQTRLGRFHAGRWELARYGEHGQNDAGPEIFALERPVYDVSAQASVIHDADAHGDIEMEGT